MKNQIIVTTDPKTGQTSVQFGNYTPLQAAAILCQVSVQLMGKAMQDAGSPIIHAPISTTGVRLS